MKRFVFALVAAAAAGCGGGSPTTPAGDPAKRITWEEFRKLPPEEQADPYVLTNLDDDARKKLNNMLKQKGK